jgi:PPOX class probable F420-dependent enzyme
MEAAKALAFARKNPHAVLATMKRDGTPQLSPVLVGVDSQDRLVVSTRETAMKTLNVRRDPRGWLCVLNDRFFGDWAQLSGDVRVEPDDCDELERWTRSDLSGQRNAARGTVTSQCPRHDDQRARIPLVYMRWAITTRPAKNSAAAKMIMPRPV